MNDAATKTPDAAESAPSFEGIGGVREPAIARVNKSMSGFRGRVLHFLENCLGESEKGKGDGILSDEELERVKRRVKMMSGEVWDDIRAIINELEAVIADLEAQQGRPASRLTDMRAQIATLNTHVIVGGAGTLKGRVDQLERR